MPWRKASRDRSIAVVVAVAWQLAMAPVFERRRRIDGRTRPLDDWRGLGQSSLGDSCGPHSTKAQQSS